MHRQIWRGAGKILRPRRDFRNMNASAYLKSQGWRGDGHSLDSNDRGIRKPLLVSKKVDVLGVGVNKHAAVSDQWWMRAYDSGLKDLGSGKKSTLATVREQGVYKGGLYGRFVKGDSIAGTFEGAAEDGKKRKRDEEDSGYESHKKVKSDFEILKKRVRNKVGAFIVEATNRGLVDPKLKSRKDTTNKMKAAIYGEAAIFKVFHNAGLVYDDGRCKAPAIRDKYGGKRKMRTLKKAAKAFVVSQLPEAEREQFKDPRPGERRARKLAKRAAEAESKAARNQEREAARLAAKEIRKKERAEKRAEKLMARDADSQQAGDSKSENQTAPDATPSFTVDTTGDAALTQKAPKSLHVIDSDGNVRYTVDPEVPVPLDPSIWDGIVVKTLPRKVRNARRQWMKEIREARKAASGKQRSTSGDKKKLKVRR